MMNVQFLRSTFSKPKEMGHARNISSVKQKKKEEARSRLEANSDGLQIALDCGGVRYYDMTDKETKSFARQISGAYADNLDFPRPCQLHLVGVVINGALNSYLRSYYHFNSDSLINITSKCLLDVFSPDKLIYLTPSSSTVLTEVSSSNVYVLGGLVDTTVVKGASERVANGLGVKSACLPIKDLMMPSGGHPGNLDLPINHVFSILMEVWHGKSWSTAMSAHMARRKQWVPRHSQNPQLP